MATAEVERPEAVEDEMLEYLDDLRDSGVTNMYGAASYIMDTYDYLSQSESYAVLKYWMETFNARHMKVAEPTVEQIQKELFETGLCQATDGCMVEADGICPHGCNSWPKEWGMA